MAARSPPLARAATPMALPYALIHRSAWNRYSAHFASRIVHKPSAKGARMVPAGLHAACRLSLM